FLFLAPHPTETYTLSLHDSLPILVGEVRCATFTVGCSCTLSGGSQWSSGPTYVSKYAHVFRASLRRKFVWSTVSLALRRASGRLDRKSTRLNCSHVSISYAVFCLK